MPQIPNAPGTRYAFRTCIERQAPQIIGEMQKSGWLLDSWSPLQLGQAQGDLVGTMMLAFTRHDPATAVIDVAPVIDDLVEARDTWKAKLEEDSSVKGIVTGLSFAIDLLRKAAGG